MEEKPKIKNKIKKKMVEMMGEEEDDEENSGREIFVPVRNHQPSQALGSKDLRTFQI